MSEPSPQSFRLAIGQAKIARFTLDLTPASSVAAWTMAFYFRRKGALMFTKTTGSGITCTDGATGEWEVLIDEEDTTDVAGVNSRAGHYDWSFWRTDDASETPLAYGTCDVYRTAKTG